MSTPNYALVLGMRYPDLVWTIRNNDYATLVVFSGGDKPLQADLDALWDAVENELAVKADSEAKVLAFQQNYPVQTQLIEIMRVVLGASNATLTSVLSTWDNL